MRWERMTTFASAAWVIVALPQQPSGDGRHAEHSEEPRVHPNGIELHGIAVPGEIHVTELNGAEILEGLRHVAGIPEVAMRP